MRQCFQTFIFLAIAAALTGCTAVQQGNFIGPEEAKAAAKGAPISQEPFEKAGEAGEVVESYNRSWFWLLPLNLSMTNIKALDAGSDEATIETLDFDYNGLGPLMLFLLPVHVSLDKYIYAEEGMPDSAQTMTWTPIWATSNQSNWPADRDSITAKGIPLFYGNVKMDGKPEDGGMDASVSNTLWSLGPAWLSFSSEDTGPRNEDKGYVVAPLLLGGPLGSILWTSANVTSGDGESLRSQNIHGPLFGLLGYTSSYNVAPAGKTVSPDNPEADQETFMRLITLGILWTDIRSEIEGQPESRSAVHGPLWGMFGWGKSEGRPVIKLLWIPIPVGPVADE
ncbi:MAG: hypothetical protein RLY93_20045 [Sumerlaeia bacterium]